MSLQARIDALVNQRIEAAISTAIDKALGAPAPTQGNPAASLKAEAPVTSGKVNSSDMQDMADVIRRALRYSKDGKVFSAAERNVAKRVVKKAKIGHTIVNTGRNDVWLANGCGR